MIPVSQTVSGAQGNCLRAAVASLLQLNLYDVPPFELFSTSRKRNVYAENWDTIFRLFLDFHGCCYHGTVSIDRLSDYTPDHGMSGYFIGGGKSPRGDFDHAVLIGRDGRIAHDPHPSGAGVVHVKDFELIGLKSACLWGQIDRPISDAPAPRPERQEPTQEPQP